MTTEQCEALYEGCSVTPTTITTTEGEVQYRLWCPCGTSTGGGPAPTPAPSAQGDTGGSCFSDTSTVVVRRQLGEAGEAVPLSALKAGDSVLTVDRHARTHVFTVVKEVLRSPSVKPFVSIAMRPQGDQEGFHLDATEHHTFPTW